MGYVPNIVAQSLQTKTTRTIGIIVASINDPFFGRIVEGIENVAQEANYSIFLSTSRNDPDQEMAMIEHLYRRRVDAIIINSLWRDRKHRQELDRIKVPIVSINNQTEGEDLHSIAVDDVQGGYLATKHLLDFGHRQIGFVGTENRPKSNRQRLEGFKKAHENAAVPMDPDLITTPEAEDDVGRGKRALDVFREAKATAAFCYNDMTAIGLMTACRDEGIRVPEEFSIVGYDDLVLTNHVTPSLTTIHQPRLTLGKRAMQLALDLLNKEESPVSDQILECGLVVRKSTGPLSATS